jgi:hypothetical protein
MSDVPIPITALSLIALRKMKAGHMRRRNDIET